MNNIALNEIIQKLDVELTDLKLQSQNILFLTEKAAGLCWLALIGIKKIIIKNDFQDRKEEIHFFKHIKPKVFSKFIYYVKLFEIECHLHNAFNKYQIKYLNHVLKDLNRYFEENIEFCQYFWRNQKCFDDIYFLREKSNLRIHTDNIYSLIDYKFSTAHDNTIATIIAYEQLTRYIDSEMNKLKCSKQNNTDSENLKPFQSNAEWTGQNTDAVELIYALVSVGVINHGKIGIKELARLFEKIFNIKLDDIYRTFKDIQGRTTVKTKFLDNLREALLKRFDDMDK